MDEGNGFACVTFVISGEASAAADPGEGALHDPALWEHHEAMLVATADNLELPAARAGDGRLHLSSLVACIADDAFDEGEAPSSLPEQRLRAVTVLDARWVDVDGEQQAERVGQNMALAADHLFAGVVTRRVERSPPLTAPFAVWLSMIAVVGLASRPAFSRTST